eukprot:TRINITY_DN4367_c0_g2_i1.p1 TRINITY_DN4367_c0_g2~~TRINITY_DN4367_c0_g2_i1.p1  ORF type:complete len:200 (-),score=23.58 TRINITY_DN4367_c0_g2_i1:366-965(-)
MSKWGNNNLRIALICASNQNRSMEAHSLFVKKGYTQISSYGTNSKVKLPGPSIDKPIVYDFGTPYSTIAEDLRTQDEDLYTQKGLLHMLQRNMKVKRAPERFQDTPKLFDIIITFEERVFDIVTSVLNSRDSETGELVHVLNLNVTDNHEAAVVGALDALSLVKMIEDTAPNWHDKIDQVLDDYQVKNNLKVLHFVAFY